VFQVRNQIVQKWIVQRNSPILCWRFRRVINSVIYPSIDAILIKTIRVLLTMPVASATAEMSFSVLRCLKHYARSTMKIDRLSSLGLVHIHRDFEVDL
jgi:hypothetical protein